MKPYLTLLLVILSFIVNAQQRASWLPFYVNDVSAYTIKNGRYDGSDEALWYNYQDSTVASVVHYKGRRKLDLPFIQGRDSFKTYEMGLNLRKDSTVFKFDNINNIHYQLFLNETEVGDTLLKASDDSNLLFYGIVDRKATTNLFNNIDSIISLRLFQLSGYSGIVRLWLNRDIILSKNYGWVSSPLWTYFPIDTSRATLSSHNRLVDSPQVLADSSIFDFNVGDEFHYQYFEFGTTNKQTIRKVISRTETPTTIQYLFQDSSRTIYQSSIGIQSRQTIESYQKGHNWRIPTYASYDDVGIYSSYMNLSDTLPTLELFEFLYPNANDSILDGTNPTYHYTYRKGLGLWQYYSELYGIRNVSNYLVYYKKGNATWGTPFVLSNKEDLENKIINIYPNPVSANLTIDGLLAGKDYLLQVYSLDGKLLSGITSTLSTSINNIDLANLNTGHYWIMILDNENTIVTRRIIQKQ
jgi:Secretion system C-terminal sorting domain